MLKTNIFDERGSIETLCELPVQSVLRIFSNAGSTRSNHYHKTDWHILYVVSGLMECYERPAGSDTPPRFELIGPGQYIYTGPMVEHTTKFPKDTVLLCFAGNKRDTESYEQDLVRTQDLSAL